MPPIIYNGDIWDGGGGGGGGGSFIPLPLVPNSIVVTDALGTTFVYQPLASVIEGIKYAWADAAARIAQTGMVSGELGVQRDTGDVYRYNGATWVVFFNLQDGASANANLKGVVIPFAYNTASPLTIAAVVNGEAVIDSEIVIETPFDDVAAVLDLGTVASPSALIPAADNDPQNLGNYGSDENINFTGPETVRLTISPGASTQGSGYVLVILKK